MLFDTLQLVAISAVIFLTPCISMSYSFLSTFEHSFSNTPLENLNLVICEAYFGECGETTNRLQFAHSEFLFTPSAMPLAAHVMQLSVTGCS